MGISGLLQFLKEYRIKLNVSKYAGQTVAVDASCWIHQGAYYADFSEGIENATQKIINYITKRVRMLQEHKIIPILVFDGESIYVKKRVLEERTKARSSCREKVAYLMKDGRPDEANRKFGESFSISSYLIQRIIRVIKGYGVQHVIAPYEADSQLAYLFHSGKASLVITEDSDLIAFGVTKLLYKMDNDGNGYHLDVEPLFNNLSNDSDKLCSASSDTDNQCILISDLSQESENNRPLSIDSKSSSDEEYKKRDSISSIGDVTFKPIFSTETFLPTCILAG
jgi:exonuclease-1